MKRSPLLAITMTLALSLPLTGSLACGGDGTATQSEGGQQARAAGQAGRPAQTPPQESGQPDQPSGTPAGQPAQSAPRGPEAPALSGAEMSLDPNSPAAKVNGVPITVKDLDQAMAQFLRGQGAPHGLPPEQIQRVRQIVLDALIGTELLYQKSKADGITATQEEIDKIMAESRKPFPSEEAWQVNLKEQGLDPAAMTALVSRNVGIDKVIKREVIDKVSVTDEELAKYYGEHPDQMQKEEEVRASHILFRIPEGSSEEAKSPIRERAEAALSKAKAGGDFSDLAREHSEDPGSAQKGGDLGFFKRGMMVPPFESAAFALSVGQISDIVESQFGYHIIKVTEKHPSGTASLEEVREPLRGFLQQQRAREMMQSYIETLKGSAKIEIF